MDKIQHKHDPFAESMHDIPIKYLIPVSKAYIDVTKTGKEKPEPVKPTKSARMARITHSPLISREDYMVQDRKLSKDFETARLPDVNRLSFLYKYDMADDISEKVYHDFDDISLYPSYTNFRIPYEKMALDRYRRNRIKYEKQFKKEIKKLEEMQPRALDAARFHRILSVYTLWPPLHTVTEIDLFFKNYLKIPADKQKRLDFLMREVQY